MIYVVSQYILTPCTTQLSDSILPLFPLPTFISQTRFYCVYNPTTNIYIPNSILPLLEFLDILSMLYSKQNVRDIVSNRILEFKMYFLSLQLDDRKLITNCTHIVLV